MSRSWTRRLTTSTTSRSFLTLTSEKLVLDAAEGGVFAVFHLDPMVASAWPVDAPAGAVTAICLGRHTPPIATETTIYSALGRMTRGGSFPRLAIKQARSRRQ